MKKLIALLLMVPALAFGQPFDAPRLASLPAQDLSLVAAFTGAGNNTYFTAVAATKYDGVIIQNALDAAIVVSFDGGTTDHITMDAGDNLTINFREFGLIMKGAIALKDNGSSPTSGTVRILLLK